MTTIKLTIAALALTTSTVVLAENASNNMDHGQMDHSQMDHANMTEQMHEMMQSTYPKDGAMMMQPVEHLSMKFNHPMRVMNVKLIDSNGKPVAIQYKRGGNASRDFTADLPKLNPDTYRVHWKAKGEDGHMMEGNYGFMQH